MCTINANTVAKIQYARETGAFPIATPGDVFNYYPRCSKGISLEMLVDTPFAELLLPALWQGALFFVLAYVGYTFLFNGLGLANGLRRPINERPMMIVLGLLINKLAYMPFYHEFGAVLWRVLGDTIFGVWTKFGYYTCISSVTDLVFWL